MRIFVTVSLLLLFCAWISYAYAETDEERRLRLQSELQQIELDIEQKRGVLKEKQAERTTLERDVAILDAQIEKAQLSIKYRTITLTQLSSEITDKLKTITALDEKVVRSEASLAQLIRRTREMDETTLAELALSGSLNDVFADIDSFEAIERSMQTSFDEIAALRADLSERKRGLEERHEEEDELRKVQTLEKQAIERKEKEKQQVLKETKGQEKAYQDIISEREKNAAEIRAALFGLRDSSAIKFEDAYRFAKEASVKTGVRSAVILGILAEESNLGENVGTGNWKTDMKPERDWEPFKQITSELGLNPDTMPVSKKAWYGWGGAMGPAQFIPSTWMLYKDRIANAAGQTPPNPWDARTAIFATAILMMDNGADKGTRAAERLAALRYLAGWKNATRPEYAFYGDDVMELADKFQGQIDILEGR